MLPADSLSTGATWRSPAVDWVLGHGPLASARASVLTVLTVVLAGAPAAWQLQSVNVGSAPCSTLARPLGFSQSSDLPNTVRSSSAYAGISSSAPLA